MRNGGDWRERRASARRAPRTHRILSERTFAASARPAFDAEPDPGAGMNWQSMALLLAQRSEKPLFVLDAGRQIVLANTAAERLLGVSRYKMTGRRIDELLAAGEPDETEGCFREAMLGSLRQCRAHAVTGDGQRLALTLGFQVVGGEPPALLAEVLESTYEERAPAVRDVIYEVSASVHDFGRLKRVFQLSPTPDGSPHVGGRCYEVLFGRDKPCAECPLTDLTAGGWPRTAVMMNEGAGTFRLVTAELIDAATFRMSLRTITEAMLSSLMQARADKLAEQAALSDRERDVLKYLLMGRTLEDIATILGISRRTVKFHQGNVLEKMGADSRVDLLRLMG